MVTDRSSTTMAIKQQKIKTTIYTYQQHTLFDRFNSFVSSESFASVSTQTENGKTEPPKSPERLLFLAVVYQALLDATKKKNNYDSDEVKTHRSESIRWFTQDYGTVARDFEDICLLAGINPEQTRGFVKKIFKKEIKFTRKRINVLINSTSIR